MAKDFLLDEDLDLAIVDNDLVFGPCDAQNMFLLLNQAPGQLKDSPLTGVDIQLFLLDELGNIELEVLIRSALNADGATVATVKVEPQNIVIDATY